MDPWFSNANSCLYFEQFEGLCINNCCYHNLIWQEFHYLLKYVRVCMMHCSYQKLSKDHFFQFDQAIILPALLRAIFPAGQRRISCLRQNFSKEATHSLRAQPTFSPLLEIIYAHSLNSFLFGLSWKKHTCEDFNNSYDYQKFNQSNAVL